MPVARASFRLRCRLFICAIGALLAAASSFQSCLNVRASSPVIQLIELYSTNQVLIHFDTDANRTYTLQYTDRIGSNGLAGSTWSNLYRAPLLPFPSHYIVPDTRTNRMRFYRLSVTP